MRSQKGSERDRERDKGYTRDFTEIGFDFQISQEF